MAEHLLHEVDRLQLRRVATKQNWVIREYSAYLSQLSDHEIQLFGDALVQYMIGSAGPWRGRLEQAATPRQEVAPNLRLREINQLLVRGRFDVAGSCAGPAASLPSARTGFIPAVMFGVGSAASFGSLSDPTGSSVLVGAVSWLQGTLLGTLATTVAVIAVATVGLMMLAGRVNLRHGVTVVAGCFILFGASSIVAGIQSIAGSGVSAAPYAAAAPVPPPPALPPLPPGNPDPYAGASVPAR